MSMPIEHERRQFLWYFLYLCWDRPKNQECPATFDKIGQKQKSSSPPNHRMLAPTMQRYQRYQSGHRISQLRFPDSALLRPVYEVGRRGFAALRDDEFLGGPVGEQRRDFGTVLALLAFAGAFRSSNRQAESPSRGKVFFHLRGDQPPLDRSDHRSPKKQIKIIPENWGPPNR